MNDELQWLMRWYLAECDNDWEHQNGIELGTLDNRGWSLKIDLTETQMLGRPFERIWHREPTDDLGGWQRFESWWVVDVKGDKFEASCGPLDLQSVIGLFRDWVESVAQS